MSMNVDNNSNVSKSGVMPELDKAEKFEFKQVQIGSIFLKDNGDGKVSLNDFNRTTGDMKEFISQYCEVAADWTMDTYTAVVNYLHKNKDQIKEDSINDTIDLFQVKAGDKSQIKNVKYDGEWTVTEFNDGSSMRENKADNKIRYYDSEGKWIAGITNSGVKYLNTYVEENETLSYNYVSEEIGNNNVYYYSRNNKLLMADDGKHKVTYIDGTDGKLHQVEQRDSKTGQLELIGYADENEKVVKLKEFKKDPVTNKSYIEETDLRTNKSMSIYDAVVTQEVMEVKDSNTNEVTYKKVIDHTNNTITEIENGVTKITDTVTGYVNIVES